MTIETTRVMITATQRVRYRTYVDLPNDRLALYDAMCVRNAHWREFENEFADLLNTDEPFDFDDIDDLEIENVEPTERTAT